MKLFKKRNCMGDIIINGFCCCRMSSQPPRTKRKRKPVALTISAAASLTDAMTEIQDLYAQEEPDTVLTITFGSSGDIGRTN